MILLKGDCLLENGQIEDGSVDLILTDLPYGNMKNAPSTWDKEKTKWDLAIDPKNIFEIANRILRKNGKMILFSQEPYTNQIVSNATLNVPFSYRVIWEKDNFANALGCNKNMVMFTEDVLVFCKPEDIGRNHKLISYFKQEQSKLGKNQKEINAILGNNMGGHYFTNGTQFRFPKKEDYDKLQKTGFFKKSFGEIFEINNKYTSTFNLWEGNKYKSNILKYKKDYDKFHPTQKPVALLEDLIKTFSNESDLVVDLTMGSGSTGVACVNTNRNFIGIEMDAKYFNIAKKRIEDAQEQMTLSFL